MHVTAAAFVPVVPLQVVLRHRLADPRKVIDGGRGSGHPLMALRTCFEGAGDRVGSRPYLVRFEPFQHFPPPPQDALVRTEKLVG